MSKIPVEVSRRLATLSRQMRQQSIVSEQRGQAVRASDMSPRERQQALSQVQSCKQIVLKRLLSAVEACDIESAERELNTMLSYAARAKGLATSPQGQVPGQRALELV